MFGVLSGLTKAVVGVATLPADLVADVVTLGGALTDKREPYTMSKCGKIIDALDEATD